MIMLRLVAVIGCRAAVTGDSDRIKGGDLEGRLLDWRQYAAERDLIDQRNDRHEKGEDRPECSKATCHGSASRSCVLA